MAEEHMIELENISKKYKLYMKPQDRFKEVLSIRHKSYHQDFTALKDISFNVMHGETVGIIGTNGSGKSTVLKIITGVLRPTAGEVKVRGRISALLELGAGFNQEYTGLENIYLNGRMMGYPRKEMEKKVPVILEFAEIGEFIHQPVKTYSSGMFARLAFAVAINVEPDILVVDEALSVGDLFFQNKCFRKFDELREQGITILFVSHDISSVRQMCSRVLWIEKGEQVIFDKSDKVCDMYMDHKRISMNEDVKWNEEKITKSIVPEHVVEKRIYPPMLPYETKIKSNKFDILACFFTNDMGMVTKHLEVECKYKLHVCVLFYEEMKNIIVGFVMENNKGLPLFDINNFINQKEIIMGHRDEVTEITFDFRLPRLMKGMYILSAALAQGTPESHIMLTWLHGVGEIEIINPGYNSSYIEIPSKVSVEQVEREKVYIEGKN